jgi:hypothetical protein
VWRVLIVATILAPLLLAFWVAGAWAVELPAPEHRPAEGLAILRIVPTERDANRLCNTDPRDFHTACSRNTGVIIQTPCAYPQERYARLLCHELTHHMNAVYHREERGKLVWYATASK